MTIDDLPADVQDAGRDLPPVMPLDFAATWALRSKRSMLRAAARGDLKVRRGGGRGSKTTVTRLELLRWFAGLTGRRGA